MLIKLKPVGVHGHLKEIADQIHGDFEDSAMMLQFLANVTEEREKHYKKLEKLLEELEWCVPNANGYNDVCPKCFESKKYSKGHTDFCVLGNALGRI